MGINVNIDPDEFKKFLRGHLGIEMTDKNTETEPAAEDAKHPADAIVMREGYDRLWRWFSLSYASWLTLPRSMMHEMPDEWQDKMAALLEEWDETWDIYDMPSPYVSAKENGKFTRWPRWLLNYRRPDRREIEKYRITGA